jgi:RNA-directed DNA polymerase
MLAKFKHKPIKAPIIVLIDNDDGAGDIFSVVKNYGHTITIKSDEPFFHITENLYLLIKTPCLGDSGKSCIEDFFEPEILKTEIDGKVFNPAKLHDGPASTGRLCSPKFELILNRILAVMDHYQTPG